MRRSRRSIAPDDITPESNVEVTGIDVHRPQDTNGVARRPGRPRKGTSRKRDSKEDLASDAHLEFGGDAGVSAIMIAFPLLMYYMWVGAARYDGNFPVPEDGQRIGQFLRHLGRLIYEGAFPTPKAWAIYWTFFVFEAMCYLYMPGVYVKGKSVPSLGGKHLTYYCSGVWSFYTTIVIATALHISGLFPLDTLIDEFGSLMSVAILSGIAVSIIAYVSAIYRGKQHRMTGHLIYDFFMGAELNPRMFEWLDFKMFFEVRLPWFILFFVTMGACTRQYEQYGFVSGELAFLLMAHFLYANACSKGEEYIPITWDMYYEKWGFMLIFWNMAGVPLSYCHATIYLASHDPSVYAWSRPFLAFLYISYLFTYWVWDTCASQKNNFRASQRGTAIERTAFPQLPWRKVENPKTIPVPGGDPLFCDGWYAYARKVHYTADMYFALCWALITGFDSPFPWFYPVFFLVMILHRANRDIAKCRERYGQAWADFERRTPYLFIPVSAPGLTITFKHPS